jgi:phage shock protein C
MAMYCKNCGTSQPEDSRFCSVCGTATGVVPTPPPPTYGPPRPLVRSREGRQVAGVCLGFARAYGWDVLLVRILMIVGGILIFPIPEIAYVVAWLVMPEEPLSLPVAANYPPQGTVL